VKLTKTYKPNKEFITNVTNMEIGIFFFVTLTIYNNVHQELPFTGR